MRSSFLPKCDPKIWRISALPSNKLPEQNNENFESKKYHFICVHEFITGSVK
jgi:hypothetical protein